MALATVVTPGEIRLAGDLGGSPSGLGPQLSASGVTAGSYVLPTITVDGKGRITNVVVNNDLSGLLVDATTSTKGVVQIDDTYLNISSGILTLDTAAVTASVVAFSNATTSSKGIVQINDTYLNITAGVLTVDATAVLSSGATPDATTVSKGVVQINDTYLDITAGVLTVDAAAVTSVYPDATGSTKGIVQIGTGLDVTAGVVSTVAATNSTLGVVKSGNVGNIVITAGDIDIGPDVVTTTTANAFTKTQNSDLEVLPYAASIAVDASLSNVFSVDLIGNATLANPTNLVAGAHYTFVFNQDATGSRTLNYGTSYKFKSGFSTAISPTANSTSILTCISDGTNLYCAIAKGFV